MAPKCKVTYFNGMGVAEPIRYILSYGGIEFEDVRVTQEEWPKMKPSFPNGKLPVVEFDGKTAHQSIAICRYFASKVGLLGTDVRQNLSIDSTVETVVDLRVAMYNALFSGDDAKKETFMKETSPFALERLNSQVKDNGGHLVDKKLTWADLHFAAFVDAANCVMKTDIVEPYSNLKSLVNKVWSLPKISEWRKKRPSGEF